jgi:hypothetical protein
MLRRSIFLEKKKYAGALQYIYIFIDIYKYIKSIYNKNAGAFQRLVQTTDELRGTCSESRRCGWNIICSAGACRSIFRGTCSESRRCGWNIPPEIFHPQGSIIFPGRLRRRRVRSLGHIYLFY